MPIMFELLGHFISLLNSILLTNELTSHLEESNLYMRTSHKNHVNIISIDFSSCYHSYHCLLSQSANDTVPVKSTRIFSFLFVSRLV